jgi:hypothetical protein
MHINVDARNRTLEETRNVYKNVISVEPALDVFRVKDPLKLGGKVIQVTSIEHVESNESISECYFGC